MHLNIWWPTGGAVGEVVEHLRLEPCRRTYHAQGKLWDFIAMPYFCFLSLLHLYGWKCDQPVSNSYCLLLCLAFHYGLYHLELIIISSSNRFGLWYFITAAKSKQYRSLKCYQSLKCSHCKCPLCNSINFLFVYLFSSCFLWVVAQSYHLQNLGHMTRCRLQSTQLSIHRIRVHAKTDASANMEDIFQQWHILCNLS